MAAEKIPAKSRILNLLYSRHTQGATAVELCKPSVGGIDFRRRIHELRKEWHIEADTIPGKAYRRYTLIGRRAA